MSDRSYSNHAVKLFFLITILLSAAAEGLIIARQMEIMYLVLMWVPALAAFAAQLVSLRERGERCTLKQLLSGVGFRRCKLRWIIAGCGLPLIYLLISYAIFWLIHPDSLKLYDYSVPHLILNMAVSGVICIFLSLVSALGEEIGWRGFMVPALYERLGLEKTLVASSLIWCVWHLPLLIFGDYMQGTPLWYQIPAFVLCIFPVGVITGLLAIETGSVWPAAFLHAAHNALDQSIFGVITVSENKMYFVSETGILTIVCAWALAIFLYLRYKRRYAAEINT